MNNYNLNVKPKGRVYMCLQFLLKQKVRGKKIIDIGSTHGWLPYLLKNKGFSEYVGIEPNGNALAFAKKHVSEANFIRGVASKLPVASNRFDIAVLFDVIEHVPPNSEKQCLKEIYRVLKSNGVLLLSTPYDSPVTKIMDPAWYFGHRHYSKRKLKSLLNASGFEIKEFYVQGGVVSLLYMIVFYIAKWVLNINIGNTKLSEIDHNSYKKRGVATVYLKAIKKP